MTADPTSAAGSGGEETEVELNLSRPDVTTKYRCASDVTNDVLKAVVTLCVDGADIATICAKGDSLIEERTAGMYNKKVEGEKLKKGVAFPTCITTNELTGNFAPLKGESAKLANGDVCKVELGTHIDGFIAVGGHTIVIGADATKTGDQATITGRKADVLMAAWTAAQAALRTVKVGKTNKEVTEVMNTAIESFSCQPVRNHLSHQLKQHVIDGSQFFISKETGEEKVDTFTFGLNEVYAIEVLASTGDGKVKESDVRTTVYKRDTEYSYMLKTQISRKFFHEVTTRFPFLPFTAAAFEDERMAKAGISECARHSLLQPYPVLTEKSGEFVAKFKFTVLLLPGGTKQITGLSFDQLPTVKSERKVTDNDLVSLLSKQSKKPKGSEAKATDAAPELEAA